MNTLSILLIFCNTFTFVNSILSLMGSLGIIFLILRYHRQAQSVPILLAGYTGLTIAMSSLFLSQISLSSLCGYLGIPFVFHYDNDWCRWCTYLYRTGLCTLYDSYMLQTIFRSCRVVLYQRRYLHSFLIYRFIVPCAFLIGFLSMSPMIILNEIRYMPSAFYCDISLLSLPIFGYFVIRIYCCPLLFIAIVYVVLWRHVQRTNLITQMRLHLPYRLRNNTRDLIVLKRLLMTMIILIFLGLPGICLLMYFYATGNLFALVYHLTWSCVSVGCLFLCYILITFTTPLRESAKKLVHYLPRFSVHTQVFPLQRQPSERQRTVTD